jgi:putative flippase GtrA
MIKKLIGKLMTREIILYVVFGVLTTVVNLVSFHLFCDVLGVHYLISNCIAWILAVAFAFVTNKLWVFDSPSWQLKTALREAASFTAGRLITLLVELGLLALLVELMGLKEMVAKVFVAVIVVILNYIFSKLWVFTRKKE